jgi:hypothetical protein
MAELVLATVMDAIASTIDAANLTVQPGTIPMRSYAWPAGSVNPPCIVVGYPKKIIFDLTFNRGSDEATFPVWFVVGKPDDKSARDTLSALLTGAGKIKDTLDGNLGGAVQSARCVDCDVESVKIGDIEYLAALFTLEVLS